MATEALRLRNTLPVITVAPVKEAGTLPAVAQVPIDKIFEAEFSVSNYSSEEREGIRAKYERDVGKLMDSVKGTFKGKHVNEIPENELFAHLVGVFRGQLKATIGTGRMVSRAIEENVFNCYSSAVLMADALARLGKDVEVVLTPTHVLVRGSTHAFETTASKPEKAVVAKEEVAGKYPIRVEGGVRLLLAAAWNNKGAALGKLGKYEEALKCFDKVLDVNQKYGSAWKNKGEALEALGRHGEAERCFETANVLGTIDL